MTMEEQRRLRVPELARQLEAALQDNLFVDNQPIESTRQLASRYRVSPVTANRAVNQLVDRKLLYRIPGKGTFVMPRRAGGIRRIGLLPFQAYKLESLSYAFGVGLFSQYLIELLKRRNYDISLSAGIEKENLSMLRRTLTSSDALLINKDMVSATNIPLLQEYSRPVILLDQPCISELPFHQVVPSFLPGIKAIGEYLLSRNITSVVIAGISNTENHCCRRRIFREILSSSFPQIALHQDLTLPHILHDYGQQCGALMAEEYLRMPDRPAILSVSDYLAFGIIERLMKSGLEPGIDFKLISYDDIESHGIRPFGKPMVTSIEHPYKEIIDGTVKLLESLLEAPAEDNLQIIRVPAGKLIKRVTC